jgi:hypothetical protein
MRKFIYLIVLVSLTSTVHAQNRENILDKVWYAIKVLPGFNSAVSQEFPPDDPIDKSFIFKWKIKRDGSIQSSIKYLGKSPTNVEISNNKLVLKYMQYENAKSTDFEIIYCTRDFLHLKGSQGEQYFFISDDMHLDGN